MKKYRVPFSGRAHNYTDDEMDVIFEAIKKADPLTQGYFLNKFQNKFSEYLGTKNTFAVNNAAAALELAAQLCLFKSDDEVIIPAHTYTASAYPFLKKGAKIVWADIDLKTRVVNAKTIENCITKKTKAIVVVHLYGYGIDMPEIMSLAKKYKLIVVEDTAQALGVTINDKKAGTYGDFGIFSFQSQKNISTLGEGGMLVVKNDELAKLIPMLRHNGHCSFNFDRKKYWKPAMGNVEYLWPNNFCLGEIECALGSKLLERIDDINNEKRKRAIYFIDSLKNFSELEFHRVDNLRHNYHLLVARLIGKNRDEIINKMSLMGIQCAVQYYPLYRYDLYIKSGYSDANCPNTDIFFDNMISFPFNHRISDTDFEWMLEITKKCIS